MPFHVVMDSQDPDGIAPFWCGLLGMEVFARLDGGRHVLLRSSADRSMFGLQRVPERFLPALGHCLEFAAHRTAPLVLSPSGGLGVVEILRTMSARFSSLARAVTTA